MTNSLRASYHWALLERAVLVLVLALPVAANPPRSWTNSVGAGLAMTSGNSNTRNVNLSLNSLWDPKSGRTFKVDALYLHGERDGERQVDKTTVNVRFERLVEDRAFWFGEICYLRDPFRDVTFLITPVGGAGYHAIRRDDRKLTLDGALGGAVEENDANGRTDSVAVKVGQSLEWKLSPDSRFSQRLTGLWKADDVDDALYHFDAAVATTVATRVELKLSWLYDYKNRPPSPDIEKGDSALFAALLFKF